MDRLVRLITANTSEKQSRAGFLGRLAKISLLAAAAVSGLSLSVAEAVNDCCPQLSCIGTTSKCPSTGVPSGWVLKTNCGTCCLAGGGCVSQTQCNIWVNPNNSSQTCYTASLGNGTCSCGPHTGLS